MKSLSGRPSGLKGSNSEWEDEHAGAGSGRGAGAFHPARGHQRRFTEAVGLSPEEGKATDTREHCSKGLEVSGDY